MPDELLFESLDSILVVSQIPESEIDTSQYPRLITDFKDSALTWVAGSKDKPRPSQ